jgi:hypothetical protein
VRSGHKCSGRIEKGFKPNTEAKSALKAAQEAELIDKNGTQHETLGGNQAFGWNLPMPIANAFEVLIEVSHGDGAELVKDASDLYPVISMRIAPQSRSNQDAIGERTIFPPLWGGVMAISQHKTDRCGNLSQQFWSGGGISHIGRREQSRQGKPHACPHGDALQFPAVSPAVPSGVGPMGFGIDQGVENLSHLAMVLVPDGSA